MDQYELDKLLTRINELEAELKTARKYGLIWDKENTKEEVAILCEKNIPVLEANKEKNINCGENNNILIEGDNYHSLVCLNYVLKDSVDLIYIDPPYNTGHEDFIYNDKFVNDDDGYYHSKWLSFMKPRLLFAKELLKDSGIILISINDKEFANLKLLCDSIFGYNNFVENFIWIKNSGGSLSKTTLTRHEYVLCYAKKIEASYSSSFYLMEKPGYQDVVKLIKTCKDKKMSIKEAEKKLREFYRQNPSLKGISLYCNIDEKWNVYRTLPITAPNNQFYDVLHPVTNKPVKTPPRGWSWSKETMEENIRLGKVIFGKDETYGISQKLLLEDAKFEHKRSTFLCDQAEGNKQLAAVLGKENLFNNPKPLSLFSFLLQNTPKDSIILDFFAGSGTTGQAVLELNKTDNGNRRFILCTNNENNICENVTYPRLKNVITGKRNDGSVYSDGIPANLYYFRTAFIKDETNTEQAKYNLVEKVDALLCIAENIFEEKERNEYSSHFVRENQHLFIYNDYFNETKFDEFRQRVLAVEGEKIVYIYSSDENVDSILIDSKNVTIKPIPSKIYEIYKEIVEDIKRGE